MKAKCPTVQDEISTENLFMRDVELTRMFAVYCLDNITYLEKYEKEHQ